MKEVWKTVKGFERYEASNLGRLRSKPRSWVRSYSGGKDRPAHTKGKILNPAPDAGGYLRTMLNNGQRYVTVKVHRIICMVFNENKDWENLEVNHKNGIKDDNRASNLEWVTRSENIRHSFETGLQDNFLRKSIERIRSECRRFSFKEYNRLMEDYELGTKAPTLAKKYGINKKTAYQIVKGLTYQDFYKDRQAERGHKTDSC